jgi:hypothetical protein
MEIEVMTDFASGSQVRFDSRRRKLAPKVILQAIQCFAKRKTKSRYGTLKVEISLSIV